MFGVLIPEMECAVAARSAEGAVNRMKRNRIDRIHLREVTTGRVHLPMAFEGKV